MKFGVCLFCLLVSAPAWAQEPPPVYVEGAVGDPNQSVLPNLLPTRGGATIDARIDYTHFGDLDLTLLGFAVHGQWITPGGAGGYVTAPFGYVSSDADSESGIGNIELGGLYALRSPNMDVLLRGGISLDTTSDEDAGLVPITQLSPRLNDAYTTGLGTTWGRLQGQLRHASGTLRIGASGGLDLPISGDLKDSDAFSALLNLAFSIGIEQPNGIGFGVGLTFIQALGTDTDDDDNSISGFNAVVDFPVSPTTRVFGMLGIPDLDNIDDNEADLWAIGGGIRVGVK